MRLPARGQAAEDLAQPRPKIGLGWGDRRKLLQQSQEVRTRRFAGRGCRLGIADGRIALPVLAQRAGRPNGVKQPRADFRGNRGSHSRRRRLLQPRRAAFDHAGRKELLRECGTHQRGKGFDHRAAQVRDSAILHDGKRFDGLCLQGRGKAIEDHAEPLPQTAIGHERGGRVEPFEQPQEVRARRLAGWSDFAGCQQVAAGLAPQRFHGLACP
ncbi:MAG: hypothetical protein AW07_04268 [Candidatus Accumulibacter sp. SK-11]|nr:MAG: hypothetical protein AW07_04268 [Candidatus Accumulibacter sp. SK-11]